ncbi:Oidioi.mRNA.OKI2018_I69.XSR.g14321.t1.cds [Oikopleura dioica]|uniref:Protein unc-93 homolog A n=1 Tax=Oikopleura dioica TaxID=34765 RepID=A0ABN7S9I8_OIKDI|nr:Oidioi.mRNA.OKI2018_I69.XSR.g14321.t1.cds [Oikopleura dioica]
MLVCLFVQPILFKATSPRFQFAISSFGYLAFALANFYPVWYVMLPAAICLGFATGIAWSSATHFVTVLANDHGFASDDLFSVFTGVVQFSSIAGNLAAVGIVKNFLQEPSTSGETLKQNITTLPQIEGAAEVEVNYERCVSHDPIEGTSGHSSSHSVLSEEGIMVLSGACAFITVIAILLLFFGLGGRYASRLDKTSKPGLKMIVQSLKGMIKQSKNKNQLLVAPMTIYSATVLCFIMSDITRHVITPCMGVGSVPFLMITYGIGISSGCFLTSRLLRIFSVKSVMIVAASFDAACFCFLFYWRGANSLLISIFLCIGLGFTAGIFESGMPSIYAKLFPKTSESAFAWWNTLFNIGAIFIFGWSSFFSLHLKLVILLLLLIFSLISLLNVNFEATEEEISSKAVISSKTEDTLVCP